MALFLSYSITCWRRFCTWSKANLWFLATSCQPTGRYVLYGTLVKHTLPIMSYSLLKLALKNLTTTQYLQFSALEITNLKFKHRAPVLVLICCVENDKRHGFNNRKVAFFAYYPTPLTPEQNTLNGPNINWVTTRKECKMGPGLPSSKTL